MERRGVVALATAAAAAAALAAAAAPGAVAAEGGGLGFRAPIYVDSQLAGSEGFVAFAGASKRLVYITHEGTTLLYQPGVVGGPTGTGDFGTTYRNQVNLWTSADSGTSWQRSNVAGTGFFTNPAVNTGFSDPDLTEDSGGTLYGAGIDLANDSLFSSPDGGVTWPTGTVQCHEGDRPWLAGGRPGEVFFATNSTQLGHIVVRSTDSGATCSQTYAVGQVSGWTGYGKLVYDRASDTLFEPAVSNTNDLGILTLPHASAAFDSGTPGTFVPHLAVAHTTFNTFWKAVLARDAGGNLYLTWTTNARQPGTTGGCNGAASPAANAVLLVSSSDGGTTWSAPRTVASPGTTVLWPWVVAGNAGDVSVAWYSYDRLVDLACAPANAAMGVRLATLQGATGVDPQQQTVDPLGRPMHFGQVCISGTACVASGQDRRLGEFFTTALDDHGCVMVATGDTTLSDPVTGGSLPTSRPLYTVQNAGRSLTGQDCGTAAGSGGPGTAVPETRAPVALAGAALLLLLGAVAGARRRRSG